MLLRGSIEKTKNLFHETVESLKSFFFVGYQKLSKPALPAPFSCSRKKHQKDRFYSEEEEETTKMRNNNARTMKQQMKEEEEEEECSGSSMNFLDSSPVKNNKKQTEKEDEKKMMKKKNKKVGSSQMRKREEQYYYKRNGLAQKMKELEMMDVGDMEHVLDVEEAIHYYSRLKSPVYISILDKFFMDMYSEFSIPQATASSINSSKRRFGPIRL